MSTARSDHDRRLRPFDRIGVRFVAAMLAVLGVAVIMIAIAAQSMFINEHDQRLLMWVLVPAVLGAALVAMLMARPVARDASKICDAAMRVADGDLSARTGVVRSDELGEAAAMFDLMVDRLDSIEQERAVMLSSISHDLRTPLAALRASVEAIRDGVAPDPDAYLSGMERQIKALASLVDDLQLHSRIVSGTFDMTRTRLDLTELADEAMETLRPLAETRHVALLLEADHRVTIEADGSQLARVDPEPARERDPSCAGRARSCSSRSRPTPRRRRCASSTRARGSRRTSATGHSSRSPGPTGTRSAHRYRRPRTVDRPGHRDGARRHDRARRRSGRRGRDRATRLTRPAVVATTWRRPPARRSATRCVV